MGSVVDFVVILAFSGPPSDLACAFEAEDVEDLCVCFFLCELLCSSKSKRENTPFFLECFVAFDWSGSETEAFVGEGLE